MKTPMFIKIMRQLYFIRRLDSFLCALTLVLSAGLIFYTAYYEELSGLVLISRAVLYYLLAVPCLYFLAELTLLLLYKKSLEQKNRDSLDKFQINRRRQIVMELAGGKQAASDLTLANFSSFLTIKPRFLRVEILIKSKITGLVIGVLNVALIIAATASFDDNVWISGALIILITSLFLLMHKIGLED